MKKIIYFIPLFSLLFFNYLQIFAALPSVDFYQSMGDRQMYFNIHSNEDRAWYDFFAQLYKKNEPSTRKVSESPLIPEIIHHIWLGRKLPDLFAFLRHSWIEHHPNWHFVLWVDNPENYSEGCVTLTSLNDLRTMLSSEKYRGKTIVIDVSKLQIRNQELFNNAKNYGQKSDILRYFVLYELGGIYVDTDFQCIKTFEILNHMYKFYTGLNNCGDVELANGLIGSAAYHPIIHKCITYLATITDEAKKNMQNESTQDLSKTFQNIIAGTGPGFFTHRFLEIARQDDADIIAFPCSFFYPLRNDHRSGTWEQRLKNVKPESFAIHHWACSWLQPEAFVK